MTENYLATKERLAGDARRAALEREDARKIEKQRKELARKTKLAKGVRPGLRQRLHEAADAAASEAGAQLWAAGSHAIEAVRRTFPGLPRLKAIVDGRFFEFLMVVLIVTNTICLAIEFQGTASTAGYKQGLQVCNWVFTLVFLVEMLLRILAHGPVGYFGDSMNLFDATVVTISLVEFGVTISAGPSLSLNVSGLRTLRLFRAFRALKAFKLARSYSGLRTLLKTVVYSVSQARDLAFLLLLALLILALLGIELFAGTMGACDTSAAPAASSAPTAANAAGSRPRDVCLLGGGTWVADYESFDDFGSAFMSVLVVFIGENWNSVWHAAYSHSGWMATIYFVFALITGNLMILNLLLGIILGSFSTANDEEESVPREDLQHRRVATAKRLLDLYRAHDGSLVEFANKMHAEFKAEHGGRGSGGDEAASSSAAKGPEAGTAAVDSAAVKAQLQEEGSGAARESQAPWFSSAPWASAPSGAGGLFSSGKAESAALAPVSAPQVPPPMGGAASVQGQGQGGQQQGSACAGYASSFSPTTKPVHELPSGTPGLAEPAGGPEQELPLVSERRAMVQRALESHAVEGVVLLCIIISSATLALDDPRSARNTPLNRGLAISDIVFTSLFTVEAIVKMYAFGLIAPKGAYLREGWNILDAAVVLVGWSSVALASAGITSGSITALRALRALRPLRLIHHVPSMRTVVGSIFQALPGCATVASVLLFFLLVFAILGMQFFGGCFAQCDDPQYVTLDTCRGAGALWYNPDIGHFDNVLAGIIVLFEMMTTEMWPDVLHLMQDSSLPHHAPVPNKSLAVARIFSVAWIFVGALFIANLFVGVIIDQFEQLRADESGKGQLNQEQVAWVSVQKQVVATHALRRPARPKQETFPRRARVYDIVMSPRFDRAVSLFTVLNAALLAVVWFGEPSGAVRATAYANFAFVALWAAEAAAKMSAYSPRVYFSFTWNRFDFSLVLAGLLEVIIYAIFTSAVDSVMQTVGTILRLARLLRLLKVVQAIPALRSLLHTLVQSLPSLGAITCLMVLAFFIYGLLGVQLFYRVVRGEFINENVNFESLPVAMLSLLAACTGESWNGIMHDLMARPNGTDWLVHATGGVPRMPTCGLDPTIGDADCGSWIAVPYFVSFQLITFCLLLNAAIAVLLANFAQTESDTNFITKDHYHAFTVEWSKFDPHARLLIDVAALPLLLKRLAPPLGVKGNNKKSAMSHVLKALSGEGDGQMLPVHAGGTLAFHETLMSLAARHYAPSKVGLGNTRFAQMHEAAMRAAMRASTLAATSRAKGGPMQLIKRTGAKGGAAIGSILGAPSPAAARAAAPRAAFSGAPSAPASARSIEEMTVGEIHAALVIQAAAKGQMTRRQAKAGALGTRQMSPPHSLPPTKPVDAPRAFLSKRSVPGLSTPQSTPPPSRTPSQRRASGAAAAAASLLQRPLEAGPGAPPPSSPPHPDSPPPADDMPAVYGGSFTPLASKRKGGSEVIEAVKV